MAQQKGRSEIKKLEGYQLLCRIFSCVSAKDEPQKAFAGCSRIYQTIDPNHPDKTALKADQLSDRDCMELTDAWLALSKRLQPSWKENGEGERLMEVIKGLGTGNLSESYQSEARNLSTATQGSWKSRFISLFSKQKGVVPDFLAGIAVTIALAARLEPYEYFRVGPQQVRELFALSFEYLGVNCAAFLPQDMAAYCDHMEISGDIRKALACCLYLALSSVYPHKSDQAARRKEDARRAFQNMKDPNHPAYSEKFSCLLRSATICRELYEPYWSYLEKVCGKLHIKDDLEVDLVQAFRPPSCTDGLFRHDTYGSLFLLLTGKKNAGKTALIQAAILYCLHANPSCPNHIPQTEAYGTRMALSDNIYFPLLLRCGEIAKAEQIENADVVAMALQQFYRGHECGRDLRNQWPQSQTTLLNFCRDQANEGRLILFVDGLEACPQKAALCKELCRLSTSNGYSGIHICVTSKPQASYITQRDLPGFSQMTISSPRETNDVRISRLAAVTGTASATDTCRKLLERNRFAAIFADSDERLAQLLQAPSADLDGLLRSTVDKHLAYANSLKPSEDYIRLLKGAAVCIAEQHFGARPACYVFPEKAIKQDICKAVGIQKDDAEKAWRVIRSNEILVCPNAEAVGSYEFQNRLFAYSLAADYYLEMLRQAPDALLAHLYRLPPEDYSYLIVLLVKRASSVDWGDAVYATPDERSLCVLAQDIAAYSATRLDVQAVPFSLQALSDILTGFYGESVFAHAERPISACLSDARRMLLRTYGGEYRLAQELVGRGTWPSLPSGIAPLEQLCKSDSERAWLNNWVPN